MSFDLVLFGGTGDLAWRKLMPALFQAFRHGTLPAGRPHHRRGARRADAMTQYRALIQSRFDEVELAKRPSAEEFERFAALLHFVAWTCPSRRTTRGWPTRLRERNADTVVMYLATAPALFTQVCEQLRAAGLNTPQHPHRAGKAAGPRPGLQPRDQRDACGSAVRREADLPHRPLPGQAVGAEPVRAALRQRAVRAAVAPRDHRQHPDHASPRTWAWKSAATSTTSTGALRDMVQNHALQLLCDDRDGAADQRARRRDPRREAQGAALAQALDARGAGPARGARPVHAPATSSGEAVPGYREEPGVNPQQPHRNLRRAAHRDRELALGRRAVLHPHRQAAGRRATRRSSSTSGPCRTPIFRRPRARANQPGHQPAARGRSGAAPAGPGPGRRAARQAEPLAPVQLDLDFDKRFATERVGAYERLLLDVIDGPPEPVRAQRRAGRGLALGRARSWTPGATTASAPRPYAAGTWGPSAASAMIARDGYGWAEEE